LILIVARAGGHDLARFLVTHICVPEQLRRAREAAGLSLEELSDRTHIKKSVLEALERGDSLELGSFYTRAYLRTYAREVKLDPDAIIEEYAGKIDAVPVPIPAPVPADERRDVFPSARSGPLSWVLVLAAVAILGFLSRLMNPGAPPAARRSEGGAVATSGKPVASKPPPPPASADVEKLTLEFRTTGVVWVEVTADGQQLVYKLLQPGHTERIEARDELNIMIGDVAALEYRINGLPGRPLGGPAEKRRIQVTPQNYREFVQPSSPR
jgi:cytoskeletal protein RodZ